MEEKNDEFFCGEVKENSFAQALKELHLSLVEGQEEVVLDYNADYAFTNSLLREIEKLKIKVSDSDFVRIWQQSKNMWDVLISLEEPLRQVITGVPLIVAIHTRATNLRSKGVQLKRFTI
jgi:hypothetical protein